MGRVASVYLPIRVGGLGVQVCVYVSLQGGAFFRWRGSPGGR